MDVYHRDAGRDYFGVITRFVEFFFFFQAEDGIRDLTVTGVQTCALPIWAPGGFEVARALGRDLADPRPTPGIRRRTRSRSRSTPILRRRGERTTPHADRPDRKSVV